MQSFNDSAGPRPTACGRSTRAAGGVDGLGLRLFLCRRTVNVKTPPQQSSLIPDEPAPRPARPATAAGPVGDITAHDLTMGRDDALVHDTLCALQAPSGVTRVSEMMAAARLRTERGSQFNGVEVRRVTDRLLAARHATRDTQGRIRAVSPHAEARLREMLLDPVQAKAWFDAWRELCDFDRAYSLGFQEEEQLTAALRLVIFGGGTLSHLLRLGELAYSFTHLWGGALRMAVLKPFDAELFSRLEPALQAELAEQMLRVLSGFAESAAKPLEDWLLPRATTLPAVISPGLRCRLAETLLFRGDFAGARALCKNL